MIYNLLTNGIVLPLAGMIIVALIVYFSWRFWKSMEREADNPCAGCSACPGKRADACPYAECPSHEEFHK